MATLLEVATSPSAVNRVTASQYIQQLGDRLWLLVPFLEYLTAPCRAAVAADIDEGRADDAPLFEIAVYRPRALHAYIDALLAYAPAHMPGVAADIFSRLRACNRLVWSCTRLPSAVAVTIFWWIATAHHGVYDMVLATEPADSWWHDATRSEQLRDFVDAHIWRIAKCDVGVFLAQTRHFQALMAYVHIHRRDVLLSVAERPRNMPIPREDKKKIYEKHYVPQTTPRQCPPTPQSQNRPARPRLDQS